MQDAPLLDENFEYGVTPGNLTTVSGGNWVAHSGGGTNPIQYATSSLTMPSYVSSGIGGSVTFTSSGEDDNRTFAEQTSGTLYFAALVNLSYATATGDYFMHFKNAATGYAARLFARDSAGALQLGIGTSSTPVWGTTNFAYNTTYLVVAKHDLVSGSSDVFVLDTCSSIEPAPVASATGAPLTPIVGIAIRQGGATTAATGTVDGIRVATNWADAATCYVPPPLLDENFEYGVTPGNLTAVSGGNWVAHSGTSGFVQYITTSLSMPSYVSSGIGGSATYNETGEDVNRSFAEQTNTVVYYAALVKIPLATAGGDYFLHFKNAATGYAARLFARDSAGALQFGIGTSTTPGPTYGTTNFAYNTTYLVVAKHDQVSGASTVYVLDTCVGTEPVTPLATATGTALASISAIAIRQSTTTPDGTVDGIRVATNWASATMCNTAPPATLTIDKTAPASVDINENFDYTISVANDLGIPLINAVITDSLPLSATFQAATPGYELLPGNVISWTVPSIADGASAIITVTVAAPAAETTLENADYGVWASNHATRTVGLPVSTSVRDSNLVTPIAVARAAGAGWYGTVEGNVTVLPGSFATRSFTIQDSTGGLYMYPQTGAVIPPMALGDVVRVKGLIVNYNSLLEMNPVDNITWINTGTAPDPLITPTGSVGATQGKLVQIQGTALSMTGTTHKTILFNDGSGQTTVYVYGSTGINTSSFTFPMPMRVTGMSGAYTTPQVNPRYQYDMVDLRAPTVTGTSPASDATGVSPYRPLEATFSKAMAPATINAATFTLVDTVGPVVGDVGYTDATKTASFTPAAALAAVTTYTATLTTSVTDNNGIPMAAAYTWSFTTGETDVTPPSITGVSPLPDAVEVPLSSNVVITFTEDIRPSSLDQDHFILEGPFGTVPSTLMYDSTNFVVTLNPEAKFLPTTIYTATVLGTTTDWAGLPLGADYIWSFETSIEPPMVVYFGDIHNHTSISDGSGTPAQALAAGEAAGYDFMAISDHSYAIDDTEWANTLAAVEAATNSNFVALRGFEYTQGAEGHINVYNTVRHAVRTNTGCAYCDYTPNLEAGSTVAGFYQWAASTGMIGLDPAGTVMQFNHPGWINFNDWTYHPEVSAIARLEEVGNGNGSSYDFSEDEFIRSLDYGWKVGATNNADTHTAYWGTNTDHRTGVLMAELTKDALLEALRERRTYATEDKNFSLRMKANGAWMGSEIANSGSMAFEIDGTDPDGELTNLVQIITDQGVVAAEYEPNTASFIWTPQLDITPGVHYFYVRVTQADGDRIVSSPVWTMGSEDISVTDLVIQPTIPTIYNPSLLEVRVTNRNSSPRTVTVTLNVNGENITPSIDVTVPGNGDGFANFSWQPVAIGEVTVTAQITGTPAGDNPDDNARTLNLTVTDEQLPLILIDAGHGNMNATGSEMQMFVADLSAHRYNVLKNLDALTAADLNPAVVKLLMITAPQTAYTSAELTAIGDYVAAGGNVWLCGLSDYTGSVPWAATVANRENDILAAIETHTGSQINMRMNDDEIIDGDDNNGYVFGPIWGSFPTEYSTTIGINVEAMASWSVASLRGRTPGTPLTADTPGVQIVVQGDLDTGYSGTYNDPNHTSNLDADGGSDAYIYNPSWVYPNYPNEVPAGAIPVPMAAVTQLPNGAGRIMLYGDSNDAFTTYAYTAGDGKQNELFNLEAAMWLMGEPLKFSTIAEARAQGTVNQPDNLDKLVWVEGEITAAYGEFFNVLYVQDATGGITVHAPAGDINASDYTRGTKVRVVGTVDIYNGDTEIQFFEAEMVQVISPSTGEPTALPMNTHQASLEESQGWLSVITGTVTTKIGNDTLFVDDGSGPVRIFLDGYNGDFSDIQVNDLVRVTGLVSEDGEGGRIRVRNHGMHPEYSDDVAKLPQLLELSISKAVATPEVILPGSLVTYTLVLSNTGSGTVLQASLTDELPAGVTFGGFVSAGGATEQGGTISWAGNMPVEMEMNVVFTATVDVDYGLYGQTITNMAAYNAPYAGSGSDSAAFTVAGAPDVAIVKSVVVPGMLNPGEAVTYTLGVSNAGEAAALDLALTDTLPEGLTFGEWIQQNGAIENNGVITWEGDLSGEREFTFTALVDYDSSRYGQDITNEVEFASLNAGSGSASAAFTVGTPELTLVKTVETATDPAMPGEPITYTLVVHNDGTTGAVGVHIWDVLPDYVVGEDVDITTNLNAGTESVITIPATLAANAPLGSTIINSAYYENGALNGEASASFEVWGGEAILSISKMVETGNDPAKPGDPITYTIEVRNDGTADAVDVHIWDVLPDYVVGEDVDTTVDITAGDAYTILVTAMLATDTPLGSTITNTAYYTSADLSGESSASFEVWGGEAILSITKTVETGNNPAKPGDPITYTIVVRNDGSAAASDVHIWDVLPDYVVGEDVDTTVNIAASEAYSITVTAMLATNTPLGATITNTAYYASADLSGESSASFTVYMLRRTFLTLLRR